jgi:hypothetical protein
MNTEQLRVDFPEIQKAVYRTALSLDSLLVNGIPFGVIHRTLANGLLEDCARSLLAELASLEQHAPHAPVSNQPKVSEVLAALRAKCQRLIELLTGLASFRTLPLQQLRAAVSQIPLLREECAQLLQELEVVFETPKRFYQSRPRHSTAAFDDFLANLQRLFEEEGAASSSVSGEAT